MDGRRGADAGLLPHPEHKVLWVGYCASVCAKHKEPIHPHSPFGCAALALARRARARARARGGLRPTTALGQSCAMIALILFGVGEYWQYKNLHLSELLYYFDTKQNSFFSHIYH